MKQEEGEGSRLEKLLKLIRGTLLYRDGASTRVPVKLYILQKGRRRKFEGLLRSKSLGLSRANRHKSFLW